MSEKKDIAAPLLLLFALLVAGKAEALENGTSGYPRGIVTVMSGSAGKPGETYIYSYNTHTAIDSIKDGDGGNVYPRAKGSVQSHALKFLHILEGPKLLGGDIALQLAVPYVDGHVSIPALGPNVRGDSKGVADPMVGALLSWQSPTYLHYIEVDAVASWGKYERNNLISPAANNAAAYLAYCFTWFPQPEWEISSKISFNYNFKNQATDYQSGIQFVVDYGLNYRLNGRWLAGVGGFVSTQPNDDKIAGRDIGNRSRSIKIGPQLGYGNQRWALFAAYQKDIYTRNAPAGDTVMLNGFIKL